MRISCSVSSFCRAQLTLTLRAQFMSSSQPHSNSFARWHENIIAPWMRSSVLLFSPLLFELWWLQVGFWYCRYQNSGCVLRDGLTRPWNKLRRISISCRRLNTKRYSNCSRFWMRIRQLQLRDSALQAQLSELSDLWNLNTAEAETMVEREPVATRQRRSFIASRTFSKLANLDSLATSWMDWAFTFQTTAAAVVTSSRDTLHLTTSKQVLTPFKSILKAALRWQSF